MARARKTPKPKQPSVQRIDRPADPQGMHDRLDELRTKYKPELADAKIGIEWRFGWKRNKDGLLQLGKCRKVGESDRQYHGFNFVLSFNREAWEFLDEDQRRAWMFHELCHCALSEDQNGNPKKDARGLQMFRNRKHDIEEFGEVAQIFGCYKQDIENFVLTIMKSKKPPAPTLLGMIDEPTPTGTSIEPSTNGHAEPSLNGHATHETPAVPMASAARKRPVPKSRTKGKPKSRAA